MTDEKLDKFTRGREAYCTTDQTLWNVSHIDPMFGVIYLSHATSQDLREVGYVVFERDYYFTDDLELDFSGKKKLECHCGLEKYGQGGKHSDYCPKYSKER